MIAEKKPERLSLPEGARRGGNCGVTATAIAAGISFDQAWDLFEKHCKRIRNSKRWTGGTHDHERELVLGKLGVSYRVIKFPELVYDIGNGAKPSLKKFVEWGTVRGTLYIVTTSGHVQIVQDGWVTDQSGSKPIDEFWGRNKRVQSVEVIIPKRKTSVKSKYADCKLYPAVKDNPRRKGSFGYHSMKIVLDNPGILYEDYISKGGRLQDLKWDYERKWVEIEKG
jgi:hypothetical protein